MVGLPARGKSFVARKLQRYLSWLGHPTRVFNVGEYRRAQVGASVSHHFFDPGNAEAREQRFAAASAAFDDMVAWLKHGGRIAIYDATNSTRTRRQMLLERSAKHGLEVLFVESRCEVSEIIEANIRATKLRSPDYEGVDSDKAIRDFRQRITHYRRNYQPLEDEALSFVTIFDAGRKVVANRIEGYLPSLVVDFLINLRSRQRRIWITRHGESEFNVFGRVGGDAPLSEKGAMFASRLGAHFAEREEPIELWTSSLLRANQTADALCAAASCVSERHEHKRLDEIDAGICDGLTYKEIQSRYPEEFAARRADKLSYRYPRGESYEDVIRRLGPLVIELERGHRPLLIVAHQAVLRALYAYLTGLPRQSSPRLALPLHSIVEITPNPYGYDERRIELGPRPPPQ